MKSLKIALIIMMVALTSCFQELGTVTTSNRVSFGSTLGTAGTLNIAETVVNKIALALVGTYGLSQKQAVTLAHGALQLIEQKQSGAGLTLWSRTALYLSGSSFNSSDITQVAPVIIQGMLTAMTQSDAALSDDTSKILAVKAITSSLFVAIKTSIKTLSTDQRKALPGAIAQTAVANLTSGGISTASIGSGVTTIMGSTVANLGNAGYAASELTSTITAVTQGGMQGLGVLKDAGTISAATVADLSYNVVNSAISNLSSTGITDIDTIQTISVNVTSTTLSATISIIASDSDSSALLNDASTKIMSGAMSALGSNAAISGADLQSAASAIISNNIATAYTATGANGIAFDASIAASMSAGVYDGLTNAGLSATTINTYSQVITKGVTNGLAGTSVNATDFTAAAQTSLAPLPTIDPIASITLNASALASLARIGLTGITDGGIGGKTLTVTATTDSPTNITHLSIDYTSPSATGVLAFIPVLPAGTTTGSFTIFVTVGSGRSTTAVFFVNIAQTSATGTAVNLPSSTILAVPGYRQISFIYAPIMTEGVNSTIPAPNIFYNLFYSTQQSNLDTAGNAKSCQAMGICSMGQSSSGSNRLTANMLQPNTGYYANIFATNSVNDLAAYTQTPLIKTLPLSQSMTQLAVGSGHTCGLSATGQAYCWGNNTSGLQGIGTTAGCNQPQTPVSNGSMQPILFTSIVTGGAFSCGLQVDGAAVCWGDNYYGEVGNNLTPPDSTPYMHPVFISTTYKFVTLKAGTDHVCGINSAGILYCWGRNAHGQLGNGNTNDSALPSSFGIKQYAAVATGGSHTCGLVAGVGTVECWGDNTWGQLGVANTLGLGTVSDQTSPVTTAENTTYHYKALAAGDSHTCGLTEDGAIRCWGNNNSGQLGNNTIVSQSASVAINSTLKFKAVTAGKNHSCGLQETGDIWCWGDNSVGQLGEGNTTIVPPQDNPTLVIGGANYAQIASGPAANDTCAIQQNGTSQCFGDGTAGQLGSNTLSSRSAPGTIVIPPLPEPTTPLFVQISSGEFHTCGLTTEGRAFCWGNNENGQLGIGAIGGYITNPAPVLPAQPVPPAPPVAASPAYFTKISAGYDHTCGLTTFGKILCWGSNAYGALGHNTSASYSSVPLLVADTDGKWIDVATGNGSTCALAGNGGAYCWGDNNLGTLGVNSFDSNYHGSPGAVVNGYTFKSIKMSRGGHVCGLTYLGTAYCWGNNNFGQLGNYGTNNANMPTAIGGGHTFSDLTLGTYHTCGIDYIHKAYCWGDNSNGQLATGSVGGTQTSPVAITGTITAFKKISAGSKHTCGIDPKGELFCWGSDSYYQLGDNNCCVNVPVPTVSYAVGPNKDVAAGGFHTCATDPAGATLCWGMNSYGELGSSSINTIPTPMTSAFDATQM